MQSQRHGGIHRAKNRPIFSGQTSCTTSSPAQLSHSSETAVEKDSVQGRVEEHLLVDLTGTVSDPGSLETPASQKTHKWSAWIEQGLGLGELDDAGLGFASLRMKVWM